MAYKRLKKQKWILGFTIEGRWFCKPSLLDSLGIHTSGMKGKETKRKRNPMEGPRRGSWRIGTDTALSSQIVTASRDSSNDSWCSWIIQPASPPPACLVSLGLESNLFVFLSYDGQAYLVLGKFSPQLSVTNHTRCLHTRVQSKFLEWTFLRLFAIWF